MSGGGGGGGVGGGVSGVGNSRICSLLMHQKRPILSCEIKTLC